MSKAYLKKIIARSAEDLQIISACCSEGKVKINDIKYLKKNKIFRPDCMHQHFEQTVNCQFG